MAIATELPKPKSYQDPSNFAPVIDLNDLSVEFGGRPILKGLSGELRGRAIGLLGPNGAGKTTLIHTLLGFHPLRPAPRTSLAKIFLPTPNRFARLLVTCRSAILSSRK